MHVAKSGIPTARRRQLAARGWVRGATLLGVDMMVLPVAWMLAVGIAGWFGRAGVPTVSPLGTYAGLAYSSMGLLAVGVLAFNGQYSRRAAFWEEIRVAWRTVGLMALANFALNFFIQIGQLRAVPLLAWTLVAVLLPLARLAVREMLIKFGLWRRRALVVGESASARAVWRALEHERNMGLEVVGLASFSGAQAGADLTAANELPPIPVYFPEQDVESLAHGLRCEVIVVALDDGDNGQTAKLVPTLHANRFEVFVVPQLAGLPAYGLQAQHFFSNDLLLLRMRPELLSPLSTGAKRAVDIAISSALLLVLSPLMAWVAWRIWREDGGPVLYTQPRVGGKSRMNDGADFPFIKFRSMVHDADAILENWRVSDPDLLARYENGNFKLPDDPRVLKVGRWIRRSSIDELPQLWNVLRGDMSLVGPRPLLRRELPRYPHDAMELYLQVRPGITGLWQVSGRSHTSFDDRAAYDSWYVRNWSLWIDLVILLKTVRVVLSGRGAV